MKLQVEHVKLEIQHVPLFNWMESFRRTDMSDVVVVSCFELDLPCLGTECDTDCVYVNPKANKLWFCLKDSTFLSGSET